MAQLQAFHFEAAPISVAECHSTFCAGTGSTLACTRAAGCTAQHSASLAGCWSASRCNLRSSSSTFKTATAAAQRHGSCRAAAPNTDCENVSQSIRPGGLPTRRGSEPWQHRVSTGNCGCVGAPAAAAVSADW